MAGAPHRLRASAPQLTRRHPGLAHMRILILGAGAVGGYFGGRLVEAGANATFFVRPRRARLLASHGLRIDSPAGNLVTAVKTISDPEALAPFDLVLLTCKAYDLDASLNDVAGAVG